MMCVLKKYRSTVAILVAACAFVLLLLCVAPASAQEDASSSSSSSSALLEENGGVFQLFGVRGEGHHCQTVEELSSAMISLLLQEKEQWKNESGPHRELELDCPPNIDMGHPFCWLCLEYCYRRNLRGDKEESFLIAAPIDGNDDNNDKASLLSMVKETTTSATTDVVVVDTESPKAVVVVTTHTCSQECVGSILCCHICGTGCNEEYGEKRTRAIAWLEETFSDGGKDEDLPGCLAGATLTWEHRFV